MKKVTRKIEEFVLEEKDFRTILDALTYARHRIIKHPSCGARTMNLPEIERLILEMGYQPDFKFSTTILK